MTKTTTLLSVLTIAGLAGSANAAPLAYYDIESSLTVADSVGAADLTASALDATSADGTSSNFEWVGSRVPYWLDVNNGTDPTTSDIVATFNLTPDAGKKIDISTSDAFNIGVLAYAPGANGTTTDYLATVRFFVASDAAFTNILATSTTIVDSRLPGADTNPTIGNLDLDVAVSSNSTLYFGVAMVEQFIGNPGGVNSRIDGVTVNGTVSDVPEPGSLALLGLGGLLIARRRRG